MSRIKAVILLVLLALLVVACRAVGDAGAAVFAVSGLTSAGTEMKRDILALMLAYPDTVTGADKTGDGQVVIVTASGDRIVYDDGKDKSFDQQLSDADVQDMMAQPYPLDMISSVPEGNNDPGRIRCYPLLHALYGTDRGVVEKSLRGVAGCGPFNQRNGAALALEAAFGDIGGVSGVCPEVGGYVYPVNGTYNYRVIAGTSTLSPHAFGIAIDLASHPDDYWRWASREQGQSRLAAYPKELVRVMEDRGFIWGGKWAHFDYLHFEYRPELIVKARADAAKSGSAWSSGFADDGKTKALIKTIDAALG